MLKFVDITSETDIMVQVIFKLSKAIVNVNRIKPFRLPEVLFIYCSATENGKIISTR